MPIIMFSPIHLLLCNPPKSNTSAKQFYIILRYEFNPSVQAPPAPWLLRRSGGACWKLSEPTTNHGDRFWDKKTILPEYLTIYTRILIFDETTCYNLPTPPSARGARQRKPTDSRTSTGLHACGFDGTELWERPAMVLCRGTCSAATQRTSSSVDSKRHPVMSIQSAFPFSKPQLNFPKKKRDIS